MHAELRWFVFHTLQRRSPQPGVRRRYVARAFMIAAVIFDLYGTLLRLPRDSQPYYKLACRHPCGDIRPALESALTKQFPTLADFAASIGLPPQDDISTLERELQVDISLIRPFEDAIPTLVALKQRGVLIAMISNLATPYKQPFATHKLDDIVDVTVFSCDSGTLKPNPEIYQIAIEALGTTADQTIMVGDSFKADVDGPSKIGITGIHLVRSGKSSRAARVISSLEAVLQTGT